MTNDMVEIRIRAALNHVFPVFDGIDSSEPCLKGLILAYYRTAFVEEEAVRLTEAYIDQWSKTLTDMIDVENVF